MVKLEIEHWEEVSMWAWLGNNFGYIASAAGMLAIAVLIAIRPWVYDSKK